MLLLFFLGVVTQSGRINALNAKKEKWHVHYSFIFFYFYVSPERWGGFFFFCGEELCSDKVLREMSRGSQG